MPLHRTVIMGIMNPVVHPPKIIMLLLLVAQTTMKHLPVLTNPQYHLPLLKMTGG